MWPEIFNAISAIIAAIVQDDVVDRFVAIVGSWSVVP